MFYELVSYINNHQKNNFEYFQSNSIEVNNKEINEIKRIKGGRIIGGLLILSIISIVALLHIEYIIKLLNIDNINAYYLVIFFIMIFQVIFLMVLKLNQDEENFINELLMFIITLNCWNFIFINIGMGLLISFIILPMEFLFLHLKSRKYNFIKIIILFIIIISTLSTKQLLFSMLDNYLLYSNNIYIIISVCIFFVSLRMELFFFMIINNLIRGKVWYYEVEEKKEENDNNQKKEEIGKIADSQKEKLE